MIIDKDVEMFEEVLTQNTLNGNSQSAYLVSVDTFNFKAFDTQVCDGLGFPPPSGGDS
jgi:hypothetical protein